MRYFLIFCIFVLASNIAAACSIPTANYQLVGIEYDIARAFAASDQVVRATVVRTRIADHILNNSPTPHEYASIDVLERYRGNTTKNRIMVVTNLENGNCRFPLDAGTEYIFFLQASENESYTYSVRPQLVSDKAIETFVKIKSGEIDIENIYEFQFIR